MSEQPEFLVALTLQAVRRYIDDAVRSRSLVSASACATEILDTYPMCNLDHRTVEDEVARAAVKAGLAVEIGEMSDSARPKRSRRAA